MKWNLEKIINFKVNEKKETSVRLMAMKGLGVFLVVMILFTSLSRTLDTMTIPKVTIIQPEKKVIDKTVSAPGRVVQNKEHAVSTAAGLNVEAVNVSEGQEVKAGDILFTLNREDLNEKKAEIETEIEKLKLGIKDKNSSDAVSQTDRDIMNRRSYEDYNNAVDEGNKTVSRAYNDMVDAWNKLEEFRNSSDTSTQSDSVEAALQATVDEKEADIEAASKERDRITQEMHSSIEAEKLRQQVEKGEELTQEEIYTIEAAIQNEYSSRIAGAEEILKKAEEEKMAAENALAEYQSKKSGEENASKEEALTEDYKSKAAAYETAVDAKDKDVLNAQRGIEDANKPVAQDSSSQSSQMDIDAKKKELEKLEQILADDCQVKAPVDGLVTKVSVTTGNATAEGMSLLMADTTDGTKFVAEITKEQQKQIERKDKATLKFENNEESLKNLTIDMVQAKADNPDIIEVTILLPADALEIGKTATLEVEKVSEPYSLCVPIEAVHQEENKKYILTVKESSTILGTQLEVERIDVTVLNSNSTLAALEEGSVTKEQKIISASSKEVNTGDRVRLLEE
jgi:multidrug resistance efflux pump